MTVIKNHTQIFEYDEVTDISIATDGILKLKNESPEPKMLDCIDYFLIQKPGNSHQSFLSDRYSDLIKNENFIPLDDISIIRLIPSAQSVST